jgi:hypothetical protein
MSTSALSKPHPADDAKVHPKGSYRAGVLRWGYFLLLNAIAGSVAVALFVAVFYADGLDPYLRGSYEWLLEHPGVTSLMAFSPLLCSLLVGWGYAQRARKRRLEVARVEAARRAEASPGASPGVASSGVASSGVAP